MGEQVRMFNPIEGGCSFTGGYEVMKMDVERVTSRRLEIEDARYLVYCRGI